MAFRIDSTTTVAASGSVANEALRGGPNEAALPRAKLSMRLTATPGGAIDVTLDNFQGVITAVDIDPEDTATATYTFELRGPNGASIISYTSADVNPVRKVPSAGDCIGQPRIIITGLGASKFIDIAIYVKGGAS